MSLKQNIIYLYFKGKHLITSKSQYQYNHGQFLYFADLNLPQAFEVHFSNKDRGESKTQIGSNKLVEIPDEYFWNGALQIYAWVYLHDGTDNGETIYEVRIPLIKRAKPTDEEPLPVQQSAIDKAIAELNNAVDITNENADKTNADKTQVATIKEEVVTLKEEINSTASAVSQDAQSAQTAAERSEQSAQNSAESERKALDYADEAKGYAQSALESKNTASQKAQVATDASAEAKDFRDEAETFKNEAEQAKQNIVDYKNETKGYRDETLTAKDDAQTIKGDVQSLKTQIDKTATDVATNALDAKSSADSSYRSAISADNASLSASQFADEASDFADSANLSANQAEGFKNQSATNVTHYPKVVDGYWYVWDASKNEYVNTNVDARGIKGDKGDVGNGIENTVLNSDYTLTITFTDGTSYTTPSIRGEKGLKGDVGNGIASTVLNDDYTLTLTFTDGTTYKTPSIRGEKGEQGEPATDMDIHICSASEYDSETRIPTITNPNDKTFYLVPTEDGTSPDLFTEWVYVNGAWEMFGSASVDLDGYLTDVKVNGNSVVTDGVAEIPEISTPLKYIKDDSSDNGGVVVGYVSQNTASGLNSYAEGAGTRATGSQAHSEGGGTTASGAQSHAEGASTIASGDNSHAENLFTTASGACSHASGIDTIAQRKSQFVIGESNVADTGGSTISDKGDYILIAGNGTSDSNRSNAMTLDWSGNEKLNGSLTLGMNTQDETTISASELKRLKEMSPVDDVQINGQSVVANGVANISKAASQKLGVVKPVAQYGTSVNNNGEIYIVSAYDALIKQGVQEYCPIVPYYQDYATFYGLAKAAGHDEKDSTLPVGAYTDEAKTAIRNMIGAAALEDQGQDIILNTKTGNRITITDYKDNTDVQSAIVNIAPTQTYNGYSKPWGAGKGKNLCPDLTHMSSYTDYSGITHSYDKNTHTWTITDTVGGQSIWRQAIFYFDASAMAGKRVYLSFESFERHFGDLDSQVGISSVTFSAGSASVWVSPTANKKYIDVPSDVDLTNASLNFRLAQSGGSSLTAGAYITITGLQLEIGSIATDFEPYENLCPINGTLSVEIEHKIGTTTNTITEDFSNNIGIIYSGSYNILTGVVEKCSYYSSYNGESINGAWMSDRDVYEIGTLPTIGAEVAEIGGNTTSYTVNSHNIPLSVGINTIEIDSNTLSIEYYAIIERKSFYKNKTLSILGDSLSTFNGYLPEDNPHYYPLIDVQSVNDTWWMKLINALGMELNTNNSWSGAKVSGTATSAGNGNRATELGISPDVIIIWMGANDFLNNVAIGDYDGKSAIPTSVTTFSDAYAVMLNKVLTTYPDAEIWVCTLHQFEYMNDDGFPETNNSGLTLKDYNDVILTLADAFGVRVLENHKCGMTYQNRSKWYSGKNPHPNKAGHSMIANNAIRQMDNYIRTRY